MNIFSPKIANKSINLFLQVVTLVTSFAYAIGYLCNIKH